MSNTSGNLLFLQLNEVNIDAIQFYGARGKIPSLVKFVKTNGFRKTVSEKTFHEWEPWIQWVTVNTGLSLEQHKVFRLGDPLANTIPQIWESLEKKGVSVGAISPMNALNRTAKAPFFIPDPWTATEPSGNFLLKKLYGAIAKIVNDNAHGKTTLGSLFWFALGAMRYASPSLYPLYFKLIKDARHYHWAKAMVLDVLLADLFIKSTKQTGVAFSSLFLNGVAHTQHHYMLSAEAYAGRDKNPEWYVPAGVDPLLYVLEVYDTLLTRIMSAFPDHRIMVATALHQVPDKSPAYFWRPKDHAAFLNTIGVPFSKVEPRMSRDFTVYCENAENLQHAEALLASARTNGKAMFELDIRADSIFVEMKYPDDIVEGQSFTVGNKSFNNLKEMVSFVAIRNGEHDGTGYFIDTADKALEGEEEFPLTDIFTRIHKAFNVSAPTLATVR